MITSRDLSDNEIEQLAICKLDTWISSTLILDSKSARNGISRLSKVKLISFHFGLLSNFVWITSSSITSLRGNRKYFDVVASNSKVSTSRDTIKCLADKDFCTKSPNAPMIEMCPIEKSFGILSDTKPRQVSQTPYSWSL